jgi:hypothetical protein
VRGPSPNTDVSPDTTVLPGPDPDNPRDRAGAEIADQLRFPRFSGVSQDWFDLEDMEEGSVASTEEVPR